VRNIKLNGATNVIPLRLACAATSGDRRMRTFADSGWSHLALNNEGGEPVHATTIDETVDALGITRLDVLKIDAEGADFQVVLGARSALRRLRPYVLMETHHLHRFGATTEMVLDCFASLNYEVSAFSHDYSVDLLATPAERAPRNGVSAGS
jgi:hypothetical protein